MKKYCYLLLIIVFIIPNKLFASGLTDWYSGTTHIVYEHRLPFLGGRHPTKLASDFNYGNQHCGKYGKDTYYFYGYYSDGDFGFDRIEGGAFTDKFRFICALSLDEAEKIFNKTNNYLGSKGWRQWLKTISGFYINNINNNFDYLKTKKQGGNTSIKQAKKECLDLGFKEGTDSFADCVRELSGY